MKRTLAPAIAVFAAVALAACDADHVTDPSLSHIGGPSFDVATSTAAVTFENLLLLPGASVEGMGTVHPWLNIVYRGTRASGAHAVLVREGAEPNAYGAPFGSSSVVNGCLGNPGAGSGTGTGAPGHGFGYTANTGAENYRFTFREGAVTSRFSLHMLDFGDFNPSSATRHTVALVAYDANGGTVDEHILTYTSNGAGNPTSSVHGNLTVSGDACTAAAGQPGNFTFTVQGEGIVRVELETRAGHDPNIAFDNIDFALHLPARVDVQPGDAVGCLNQNGHGSIPVAIFGSEYLDVSEIDLATIRLAGMQVRMVGKRDPKFQASYEDLDGDGWLDVIVHVLDEDGNLTVGDSMAEVSGQLTDGMSFHGSDTICVVASKL